MTSTQSTEVSHTHSTAIMVLLVIIGLTVGGSSIAGASGEASDATEIDSCTTISESGHYDLTTDIKNSSEDVCIQIEADDVVLDGNGHTIDGDVTNEELGEFTVEVDEGEGTVPSDPEWQRMAVSVGMETDVSSVTVADLTVSNWFFGVNYESVSGGEVWDVTADNNGDGISAYNSSQITFADSTASNGTSGFIIDSWDEGVSEDNTVWNVESHSNALDGIAIWETTNIRLTESTIMNNDVGIVLGIDTEGTVSDTEIDESTQVGVLSLNSSNQHYQNVAVTNTQGEIEKESWASIEPSAFVFDNTTDSTIVNSTATDNEQWVYYSMNESVNNTINNLTTEDGTFSFTGTDIAVQHVPLQTDEEAPEDN